MYYHLTSKENIDSILNNGLLPKIGSNSNLVSETDKCIYLTDKESLPVWMILLNKDMILAIDINREMRTCNYGAGLYNEYITKDPIPASAIKVSATIDFDRNYYTKKILIEYMYTISIICSNIARLYARKQDIDINTVNEIKSISTVLSRLDSSKFSDDDYAEIKDYIRKYGDEGEFTLCDTYFNEKRKLYQILTDYDSGEYKLTLESFRNNIERLYGKALNVNSGGFECQY